MKIRLNAALVGASVMLAASPALALDVSRSAELAAKPDALWKLIGTFCDIQNWHPVVTNCELSEQDGRPLRSLTLPDGAVLVEEEVARDDGAMSYTYRILEGPLPVENYESTISVSGSGDGSTVSWSGRFDAKGASDDEASGVIGGIYDAGLSSLKEKAGSM
ncbi:SRPBCC family protein [Jiella mangrovi]|uniref:SRPBCC family protein n=1 Tax=Jiella mangrovi TaxID=2821407 RepID=A0ABS4BK92_9HYPH|nr:SRPBCC family protein [Jiella mangrovi]MBP0616972.1 SRPBCC family protein [Jiella mangrovi]